MLSKTSKGPKIMINYNMQQISLHMATYYEPEENHPAQYINRLVEELNIANFSYNIGRPRDFDTKMLLKLVLFAYSRSQFSCRQIELFAKENKVAMWLTQEQEPSYRTIARFIVSEELEGLIVSTMMKFSTYLKKHGLISNGIYIDGTKILANANKYSFVWKKSTLRYADLNKQHTLELLTDIKQSMNDDSFQEYTENEIDEVIARLEAHLDKLNREISDAPQVSPNPKKTQRRTIKKQLRELVERKQKKLKYEEQLAIMGNRNSMSKTDHDATFMRVKEDPMMNGQLKPAYNLQIATNNQFVLDYTLTPNPTDTRTLIPFLKQLQANGVLDSTVIADAGYGSEANYRFISDTLNATTALIPYGTMLKEKSRKWKSDNSKVMNWDYYEKDDYYIDPQNVRFNFARYSKRTDKDGFVRSFKIYHAEKYDLNSKLVPAALTKSGQLRKITVNPELDYFKNKVKKDLSNPDNAALYCKRKIDVESSFGYLKASLKFTRFTVRGNRKVKCQMFVALMAMNMNKLAGVLANLFTFFKIKKFQMEMILISIWNFYLRGSYVTTPF